MDIIDPAITGYAEKHSTPESETLSELNRETHANVLMPRMLSGHLQGRLLSMLSHMIKPDLILEIGTYTGYSAICLAEGLSKNGHLHTIDINDELATLVNLSVKKSGLESKITAHYGDAIKIIPSLSGPFDLVFIDADKINYTNYYDLIFQKVKIGGYMIADNVLWDGKVLQTEKTDKDTEAIRQFNNKINSDPRVENVLLTVRDGLMVIRKISN
jgi:predicted O-methyltransferase YrrM